MVRIFHCHFLDSINTFDLAFGPFTFYSIFDLLKGLLILNMFKNKAIKGFYILIF